MKCNDVTSKCIPIAFIILWILAIVVAIIDNRNGQRDCSSIDDVIETETETLIVNLEYFNENHLIQIGTLPVETEETETIVEETETETDSYSFKYYDFLPMSYELQEWIYNIGDKYELNYEFLLAWAMQESGGNPSCLGDYRDGVPHAYGLYQIQPEWWDGLANEHGLYDYKTNGIENCELAVIILVRDLEKTDGDLDKALSMFRWGRTDSCVEPDGRTYEQHIFDYMNWILEGEQNGN